ncbi:unnamed protein product, partial [marine sediment metagenome]
IAMVLTVNPSTWIISKETPFTYVESGYGFSPPALAKIDDTHYLCAYDGWSRGRAVILNVEVLAGLPDFNANSYETSNSGKIDATPFDYALSPLQPRLPHAFYGTLLINGAPAPPIISVEGRGTNIVTGIKGNPTLCYMTGAYGTANAFEHRLIVQESWEHPIPPGTLVEFYVN